MAFARVPSMKTKGACVADQIVDAIRANFYESGDRLPSERELAQTMGVSRNSVREALSALQILGILTSRAGDGTYVSFSAGDTVNRSIAWLRESGIDVLDVWKAKEELETMLLETAIERASDAEIDPLEAVLNDMDEAVTTGARDKYALSNLAFHKGIAATAGCPGLERAQNILLRLTQRIYRALEVRDSEYLAAHLYRSYITHREILRVLRDRDHDAAARVMANHFVEVRDFLERVSANK